MASPSSTMPAFDTHKAVKALCEAGFDDAKAEAVVDQINGAVSENFVTKAESERSLTAAINPLATKEELQLAIAPLATKEELQSAIAPLATKEELQLAIAPLVTQQQFDAAIANLATKDELRAYATKDDLAQLELRMTVKIDALTGKLLRYMGGGLALVVALIKGLDLLVG